jgi:transcriptional antiterminator RfaH
MSNSEVTAAWYCVHAKPKCEHLAAAALRALPEVEVFCPRLRFQKATVRGKVWFVEALFPGYLFVKFSPLTALRAVRHAQNVMRVVEFGGHPVPVPESAIYELKKEMQDTELRELKAEVHVGDSVQLTEGPMRGLSGIVERLLTGAERVRVLLEFLGRQNAIEVSLDKVIPESPPRIASARS